MFKKLLILLAILAYFPASAARFTTNSSGKKFPVATTIRFKTNHLGEIPSGVRETCNLPAPDDLQTTGATTNSLSFAWSPVAGTDGYGTLLLDVITGDPVSSSHIYTEFTTINGLQPDREYEFRVWSICPAGGGNGGTSFTTARTDYVVIVDIVVNRESQQTSVGNNFNLFSDDLRAQPALLFKVVAPVAGRYIFFEVEKNLQAAPGSLYIHHAEIHNDNGEAENPSEWLFGVGADTLRIPYCPDSCEMSTADVFIYHKTDDKHNHVVSIGINREKGNTSLQWDAGGSGYEILECIEDNGGNKKFSDRDHIGTAAESELGGIRISPNPFTDQLVLRAQHSSDETAQITLFDLVSGRMVYQAPWARGGEQYIIPTTDLQPGSYLLRYENQSAVQTIKVIKMDNK